jgi:hypothetical protein
MADILNWNLDASAARRQPSLEELLEEAEALLVMQQVALKSCQDVAARNSADHNRQHAQSPACSLGPHQADDRGRLNPIVWN